jgi:hypothetical protein
MASYDPTDKSHFISLCLFIATRCFRKLSKRVYQDRECWNVNVCRKIFDWTPDNKDLDEVRWIDRPKWAPDVLPLEATGPEGMTAREILKSGQLVTQWEFSAATLRTWAWLLAKILEQIELSVAATKDAQEKKQTEKEVEEMTNVIGWCQRLYMYVNWKEDVVQTLLTKTSLAQWFNFRVRLDMNGM